MTHYSDEVFDYRSYMNNSFDLEYYKKVYSHVIINIGKVINSFRERSLIKEINSDHYFKNRNDHLVVFGMTLIMPDNSEKLIKVKISLDPKLLVVCDRDKLDMAIKDYCRIVREEIEGYINGIERDKDSIYRLQGDRLGLDERLLWKNR